MVVFGAMKRGLGTHKAGAGDWGLGAFIGGYWLLVAGC
jgi:hypothetical protein